MDQPKTTNRKDEKKQKKPDRLIKMMSWGIPNLLIGFPVGVVVMVFLRSLIEFSSNADFIDNLGQWVMMISFNSVISYMFIAIIKKYDNEHLIRKSIIIFCSGLVFPIIFYLIA